MDERELKLQCAKILGPLCKSPEELLEQSACMYLWLSGKKAAMVGVKPGGGPIFGSTESPLVPQRRSQQYQGQVKGQAESNTNGYHAGDSPLCDT